MQLSIAPQQEMQIKRAHKFGRYHNSKAEQHHGGDLASEPENLSVRDKDNSQILEDRVHGDTQKLQTSKGEQ